MFDNDTAVCVAFKDLSPSRFDLHQTRGHLCPRSNQFRNRARKSNSRLYTIPRGAPSVASTFIRPEDERSKEQIRMFVHRAVDRTTGLPEIDTGRRPARYPVRRNEPGNWCIFSLLRKQLTKTGILEDKYEPWESAKLSLLPVRGNGRPPAGISLIQSGLLEDSADVNAGHVVCVGCDCTCGLSLPVCPIHSAS